jgi:hypothetical protein
MLERDAMIPGNSDTMAVHCIVHQENLYVKSSLRFQRVMIVVTKVVKFIRSKGLNHRQFGNFLCEFIAECNDTARCSDVRWLSRSKMLKSVFSLTKYKICGIKREVFSRVSGSAVDYVTF